MRKLRQLQYRAEQGDKRALYLLEAIAYLTLVVIVVLVVVGMFVVLGVVGSDDTNSDWFQEIG